MKAVGLDLLDRGAENIPVACIFPFLNAAFLEVYFHKSYRKQMDFSSTSGR
jgi:hypothetical protein